MNITSITEAVHAFLDDQEWLYAEANGCFESGMELNADISAALLQIDTNDGGLVILTALDFDVPEHSFSVVLSFANLMNMVMPMGSLYLDIEEHMLVYRLGEIYGEKIPTPEDVADQLFFCLDMIERVADVLAGVVEKDFSPEEAVDRVLQPDEGETAQ